MVFGTLILQVSDFQTATIGLVLTSAGGGFLALPLYTLLQDDTAVVANRIAVNNIANAMMIVLTAVISLLVVGLLELDLLLWLLVLSLRPTVPLPLPSQQFEPQLKPLAVEASAKNSPASQLRPRHPPLQLGRVFYPA